MYTIASSPSVYTPAVCPPAVKRQLPWDDSTLKELPVRQFRKNDFLYFMGDTAQSVYLLKKGVVKTSSYSAEGKELIRSILYRGEILGELIYLGANEREDFAQAITDVEVYVLQYGNSDEWERKNEDFSWISALVRRRLSHAQKRLESMLFNDAQGRIAAFLIEQWISQGKNLLSGTALIRNYLTHEEIASYVGTTRQTVSSSLNRFRKLGLISFDRNAFLIKDIGGLKAYQEG